MRNSPKYPIYPKYPRYIFGERSVNILSGIGVVTVLSRISKGWESHSNHILIT